MAIEDEKVKEFAEWAKINQCGYGEDEADIWFEDLPHYDALEWKVREIVREVTTTLRTKLLEEETRKFILQGEKTATGRAVKTIREEMQRVRTLPKKERPDTTTVLKLLMDAIQHNWTTSSYNDKETFINKTVQ